MNRILLLVAIAFLPLCGSLTGGQFNQVLSIGDKAPAWTDLVGVDDRKHSLDDLREKKIVVVVFTCNSCPYAVDVEDRLIALEAKYADRGVALVAINVNQVEEDLLPAMKVKAETKGFRFPYLFDPSQKIARDYGAMYTPEFYVLGPQRKVAYMGSMDDSPSGEEVGEKYVEGAIEATLGGDTPEVTETVPIGCRVRFERARRSRKKASTD